MLLSDNEDVDFVVGNVIKFVVVTRFAGSLSSESSTVRLSSRVRKHRGDWHSAPTTTAPSELGEARGDGSGSVTSVEVDEDGEDERDEVEELEEEEDGEEEESRMGERDLLRWELGGDKSSSK